MSKPKFLRIFDDSTKCAHSRLNNPVTVVKDGNNLVVSEDIRLSEDILITFTAPCNCSSVDKIVICGESYSLVDARGMSIANDYSFLSGSIVSFFIDYSNSKAYLQNGATPTKDDPIILSEVNYGDTLPATGTPGRLFFLRAPRA